MSRSTVVIELASATPFARDLAAGGVFVPDCALRLAEECDLVVCGASHQLRIPARVVYVDPRGGAGLELLGFSPEMKAQIAELADPDAAELPAPVFDPAARDDDLAIPVAMEPLDTTREIAASDEPPPDAGWDDPRVFERDSAELRAYTRATAAHREVVARRAAPELPIPAPLVPVIPGPDPRDDDDRAFAEELAAAFDAALDAELGPRVVADDDPAGADEPVVLDPMTDVEADAALVADPPAGRDDGLEAGPALDADPDADADPRASAPGPAGATRRLARNVNERLRGLTLVAQLKMAVQGELHERIVLERLYGKNVWETLLRNPRLTAPEVSRIARYGSLPRVLIEIIVGNNAWLQIPEVRRALLSNPRLAADQVMKVLRVTPKHELRLAAIQTAYPHVVRSVARMMLRGD